MSDILRDDQGRPYVDWETIGNFMMDVFKAVAENCGHTAGVHKQLPCGAERVMIGQEGDVYITASDVLNELQSVNIIHDVPLIEHDSLGQTCGA